MPARRPNGCATTSRPGTAPRARPRPTIRPTTATEGVTDGGEAGRCGVPGPAADRRAVRGGVPARLRGPGARGERAAGRGRRDALGPGGLRGRRGPRRCAGDPRAGRGAKAVMSGDPVVGSTVLRRPAIQSPNYAAGAAGWTVNADGSAEFNALTLRSVFQGGNFVINNLGMFVYSALPPALGGLVASLGVTAAGTDSAGNAYLTGDSSYSNVGGF